MFKIRRSCDGLIFNMGITIPGKDGLYIETGPSMHMIPGCWRTLDVLACEAMHDFAGHFEFIYVVWPAQTYALAGTSMTHDDVIKWKHFPRYWPFVRGIHRSAVNSPHKGQWRGALVFSLICTRINGWVNTGEAGDLRRHRAHYGVIVMKIPWLYVYSNSNTNILFSNSKVYLLTP